MVARTYPNGAPCWIDTEQPDPSAATEFYGGLFGWTFQEAVPPGAPGSYLVAQLDGQDVAAVAPATDGAAKWNTYVAVDDADRTTEQIPAAGGRVLRPPQDVGPGGRSAWMADPTGAEFGLWQPRRRLGAQAVNVPGGWNFSDLHTADTATAERFYRQVFGWDADRLDFSADGITATMWRLPGYGDHLAATADPDIHSRQAALSAPPGFADAIAWLDGLEAGEATPHWHVTITVADRDETVERARRLGGAVHGKPVDTSWTRTAVVRDPQGAVFTVSQFAPPA